MKISEENLLKLLEKMSADKSVYVPKEVDGVTKFALYQTPGEARFDLVNTTLPPKDMLFPQTQKMYVFGAKEDGSLFVNPIDDSAPQVIFGIRSCDMHSIDCLDQVFLTKGFVDEFYQPRREKLLTVAMGCAAAAETCFCDSMGIDPNNAPSTDIQLVPDKGGKAYGVAAHTDKGKAELEGEWKEFLEDGDVDAATCECSLKVDMTNVKSNLDSMFDHPIWDQIADKCLGCGTCTYVCPTCHCFDINQENRKKDGLRFRCWDSCMFSEYTEMAGGHNPRPSKKERVRNRFMHKLCYFDDRYGMELCVGCGRCVEKCPVALDITVFIDQVAAIDPATLKKQEVEA